jgi:hypothetical protein
VAVPRRSAAALLRERLTPRSRRAAQKRVAMLLTVTSLLALAACESAQERCRKAHPGDLAASEACFRAVLQQENQELNRLHAEELRGRD